MQQEAGALGARREAFMAEKHSGLKDMKKKADGAEKWIECHFTASGKHSSALNA